MGTFFPLVIAGVTLGALGRAALHHGIDSNETFNQMKRLCCDLRGIVRLLPFATLDLFLRCHDIRNHDRSCFSR